MTHTSPHVRITRTDNLHVVEIWSVPIQTWIAQGEHLSREEAQADAATFIVYDRIGQI